MSYHYIDRVGFVTKVEDLEGVLSPKLYRAILEVDNVREERYLQKEKDIKDLEYELQHYELLAEERVDSLREGHLMSLEIIKYIEDSGRLDRRKLLDMLTNLRDTLENY